MRAGLTLVALVAAAGVTGGCAGDDAANETASTGSMRTTTTVPVEVELLRELFTGGGERTSLLPDGWWAPPPGDGFTPRRTVRRGDVVVLAGVADRPWTERYVEILAGELEPDPDRTEPDVDQYGFTDGARTVVVLPVTRESGIPSGYAITTSES